MRGHDNLSPSGRQNQTSNQKMERADHSEKVQRGQSHDFTPAQLSAQHKFQIEILNERLSEKDAEIERLRQELLEAREGHSSLLAEKDAEIERWREDNEDLRQDLLCTRKEIEELKQLVDQNQTRKIILEMKQHLEEMSRINQLLEEENAQLKQNQGGEAAGRPPVPNPAYFRIVEESSKKDDLIEQLKRENATLKMIHSETFEEDRFQRDQETWQKMDHLRSENDRLQMKILEVGKKHRLEIQKITENFQQRLDLKIQELTKNFEEKLHYLKKWMSEPQLEQVQELEESRNNQLVRGDEDCYASNFNDDDDFNFVEGGAA